MSNLPESSAVDGSTRNIEVAIIINCFTTGSRMSAKMAARRSIAGREFVADIGFKPLGFIADTGINERNGDILLPAAANTRPRS